MMNWDTTKANVDYVKLLDFWQDVWKQSLFDGQWNDLWGISSIGVSVGHPVVEYVTKPFLWKYLSDRSKRRRRRKFILNAFLTHRKWVTVFVHEN